MQQFTRLRIRNFRSFRDEEFFLSSITPIVGQNNGGKTNFLKAVKWIVNRTGLSDDDFNDPEYPVIVECRISGIGEHVLEQIGEKHRSRIEEFIEDDKLLLRRIQSAPNLSATQAVLYVKEPGKASENEDSWRQNPTGIENAIKAIFPNVIEIEAMQDVTEDIGKSKTTSTIGKLGKMILAPFEGKYKEEFETALSEFSESFSVTGTNRIPELASFDKLASAYLNELFPGLSLSLGLTMPELSDVLSQVKVVLREADRGESWKNVQTFGHGAQRSVQIALLRYIAQYQSNGQEARGTVFLIDQPELYMHPHAIEQIRVAIKILAQKGYQIIFSTHSPLMITERDIWETVILVKDRNRGTHARNKASELTKAIEEHESQTELLFELSNSSEFLFADRVLLAEGESEKYLLPPIYKALRGSTLVTDRIGFVKLRGVGSLLKCMEILKKMGFPVRGLVDLDFAFRTAIQGGVVQETDEEIAECKKIFLRLAAENDFHLESDGFPDNKGNIPAAKAFKIFAKDTEARPFIQSLHEKLKTSDIWLLRSGDFDACLGLQKKKRAAWAEFLENFDFQNPENSIKHHNELVEFVRWVNA